LEIKAREYISRKSGFSKPDWSAPGRAPESELGVKDFKTAKFFQAGRRDVFVFRMSYNTEPKRLFLQMAGGHFGELLILHLCHVGNFKTPRFQMRLANRLASSQPTIPQSKKSQIILCFVHFTAKALTNPQSGGWLFLVKLANLAQEFSPKIAPSFLLPLVN
jgi:hypothetical protein